MKLVLTSGGISNKSIEYELKSIIGKDFKDLKLLFCIGSLVLLSSNSQFFIDKKNKIC